jgi:hypothetical protein
VINVTLADLGRHLYVSYASQRVGRNGEIDISPEQASRARKAGVALVERARATRAGLTSPHPRRRWTEAWALTLLNAWLETWVGNLA